MPMASWHAAADNSMYVAAHGGSGPYVPSADGAAAAPTMQLYNVSGTAAGSSTDLAAMLAEHPAGAALQPEQHMAVFMQE